MSARKRCKWHLRATNSTQHAVALPFRVFCERVGFTTTPPYRLAGGTIPFIRKYSTICP
jgi:hypothetical protein